MLHSWIEAISVKFSKLILTSCKNRFQEEETFSNKIHENFADSNLIGTTALIKFNINDFLTKEMNINLGFWEKS